MPIIGEPEQKTIRRVLYTGRVQIEIPQNLFDDEGNPILERINEVQIEHFRRSYNKLEDGSIDGEIAFNPTPYRIPLIELLSELAARQNLQQAQILSIFRGISDVLDDHYLQVSSEENTPQPD